VPDVSGRYDRAMSDGDVSSYAFAVLPLPSRSIVSHQTLVDDCYYYYYTYLKRRSSTERLVSGDFSS